MKIGVFQQIKVREEAHLIKPSSNHSIKHKVIQTNNGGSYHAEKSRKALMMMMMMIMMNHH